MILGKVIGHVVSTQKNSDLVGHKLLLVALSDSVVESETVLKEPEKIRDMNFGAQFVVSVDTVCAGVGEIVLVVTGQAARNAVESRNAAVDSAIVGIVDTVDVLQ